MGIFTNVARESCKKKKKTATTIRKTKNYFLNQMLQLLHVNVKQIYTEDESESKPLRKKFFFNRNKRLKF